MQCDRYPRRGLLDNHAPGHLLNAPILFGVFEVCVHDFLEHRTQTVKFFACLCLDFSHLQHTSR